MDVVDCQPTSHGAVYNSLQRLLAWLFPASCRLCGCAIGPVPGLCAGCLADAPWLQHACPGCGRPLAQSPGNVPCGRCQHLPPAFDSTTALFHYQPPVDYLIKRLKFAAELKLAPVFARLLAARLRQRHAPLPSRLVAVPLHPRRLRERGFNQAGELARCLGRELGLPHTGIDCRRKRDTRPQSTLTPNARRLNLRNAFSAHGPAPAKHVAIVDDVMTTGHTANELSRALKQAGVERVEVWVIARAG